MSVKPQSVLSTFLHFHSTVSINWFSDWQVSILDLLVTIEVCVANRHNNTIPKICYWWCFPVWLLPCSFSLYPPNARIVQVPSSATVDGDHLAVGFAAVPGPTPSAAPTKVAVCFPCKRKMSQAGLPCCSLPMFGSMSASLEFCLKQSKLKQAVCQYWIMSSRKLGNMKRI